MLQRKKLKPKRAQQRANAAEEMVREEVRTAGMRARIIEQGLYNR